MSAIVDKLLSDEIKALTPYQSARRLYSGGQDWLNANESPFANEYQLDDSKLNRYPSCQPTTVVSRYADYASVRPEQTLVTRGADEGIELLIRTFCQPAKDSILICPPTYGMYAISAQTCNVGVVNVPTRPDFSLNVDEIIRHVGQVNLVFICSPNNPTGNDIDAKQIELVLDAFADSALVVVDEAYIEFSSQGSWSKKLAKYPNLVVLRTLSKAFALAGLRCGFTLANEAVIEALLKVIAPYPIPEPVAQIASQALSNEGISRIREQITQLNEAKTKMLEALNQLETVSAFSNTAANFILIRAQQKDQLMSALVEQGILIRDQSRQQQLDDCLRISIGNTDQNRRLIDAITRFYQDK